MVKRMSDTRKMSQEKADQLLEEIAGLEIELIRELVPLEAEINRLKSEAAAVKDKFGGAIKLKADELKTYVLANPDKFKKPKSRKTPFGKYGMRDLSNLEIDNEMKLLEFLMENRMTDYFKTEHKVMKTPLRAAIKKGLDIPGVRIEDGESSFYQVDKTLLKQAEKETIS